MKKSAVAKTPDSNTPGASTNNLPPDVIFAQKASAVVRAAGIDPRLLDLERFRAMAPVIFVRAYQAIYKVRFEFVPLHDDKEDDEEWRDQADNNNINNLDTKKTLSAEDIESYITHDWRVGSDGGRVGSLTQSDYANKVWSPQHFRLIIIFFFSNFLFFSLFSRVFFIAN